MICITCFVCDWLERRRILDIHVFGSEDVYEALPMIAIPCFALAMEIAGDLLARLRRSRGCGMAVIIGQGLSVGKVLGD